MQACKTTLLHALCCATVAVACGGGKPVAPVTGGADAPLVPSTKATTKTDPAFAACHSAYKPASHDQDVGADVDAMAGGCAAATKMTKVGATLTGEASAGTSPTFPLSAAAGKCYRVYGIAQSTMQDTDITVLDSTGGLVSQDTTDDVSPVVTEDGKVCFTVADAAVIRVSAGAGAGKFALQVWSD